MANSSDEEQEHHILSVTDVFATVEDAKEVVKEFNEKNFVDFKVEINNKTYLKYSCKHGGRGIRLDPNGNKRERIHQHYNSLKCKAVISFYKSRKDGSLKCTHFFNEHNHEVSGKKVQT